MKKILLLLTFIIPLGQGFFFQGGPAEASDNLLTQNPPISKKQAQEIALTKVKGEVVMVNLEDDDGRQYYEVIIKSSGGIYEVEIDAKTGQVLEVEQEGADDDDRDGDDDHEDHGDE